VPSRKTSQALAARSQIVLACAEGGTIGEVARRLGVSRDIVSPPSPAGRT
jgi:transposase-like protein